MSFTLRVDKCRICGCTKDKPCFNQDGKSCRSRKYKVRVEEECPFCTTPSLRKTAILKPRIHGVPPINMRNIRWVKEHKTYQVRISVKSLISGGGSSIEMKCFSAKKYGSRKHALTAAIQWRDEMRELAGLPSVQKAHISIAQSEPIEVSIDLTSINPDIPEGTRFHLITNRDKIRRALENQRIQERQQQRVMPNREITLVKAHKGDYIESPFFELVSEGSVQRSNKPYSRSPKYKKGLK